MDGVTGLTEWDGTGFLASLVGRTITAIDRTESRATLTLDDGRRIEFRGWGYDEWGLDIDEAEEPLPVEVGRRRSEEGGPSVRFFPD